MIKSFLIMQRSNEWILSLMIGIYCRKHHVVPGQKESSRLCESCEGLKQYSIRRLAACPFENGKPVWTYPLLSILFLARKTYFRPRWICIKIEF